MQMYSLSQEAYILLASVYGGILIGFIYDLYKIVRLIFNPKKIATLLQDLIFWVIISLVAFYVLIISNDGIIRFYNFLGFILGAFMYYHILSALVTRTIIYIVQLTRRFILDLWQLIKYPFRVGLCLLEGPYSYCKKRTKPVYYKSKRIIGLPKRAFVNTKKNIKVYFTKK
ncbi:spore cortex biosynthesis protein YabQ [Serpentinicella alkaliphila]|uniref:Spore cortex biosynthesis protein YabQ n=1 Tax=Serpentinicella alkaliphila TaxID=1734049 RepID=A0A4V6NSD1_9FIRM|nr:spore cortex biosynthesis protein YabQ [Serpentinicella alkaliphila]QUH25071.1 spore cortex biosynthesis protein YabQ [Serpentinicella alkaliphila]TCQ00484.1 spore cortex biosynthesis protein YabQ [Serpentinicella alkaliphila]